MIIRKWRDNYDLWSYTHWLGCAYLTATCGWIYAAKWAIAWEAIDTLYSATRLRFFLWIYSVLPYKRMKLFNFVDFIESHIDDILDRRGFSYGDLIMCAAGILTYYAHVGLGWWAGLICAGCVFGVVELSRK
jgi:hypothetical protein